MNINFIKDLIDLELGDFCEQNISRHIIDNSGKFIRTKMLSLLTELIGVHDEKYSYLAAAIELIHTASLLHDDVLDDAHLRRSVVTVNTLWGNKSAILVGDFLFSKAFKLIAKHGNSKDMYIVAEATSSMINGETLQNFIKRGFDYEHYEKIIQMKTAALFQASASFLYNDDISKFGYAIGELFQLIDDCVDYMPSQPTGKVRGNDWAHGKITLPLILLNKKHSLEDCIVKMQTDPMGFEECLHMMDRYEIWHDIDFLLNEKRSRALTLLKDFMYNESFSNIDAFVRSMSI